MMKHVFERIAGRFDKTLGRTVYELDIGQSPVLSIEKTETLIQALYKMQHSMTSVIAVIDEENSTLSGSISMSDIKTVFRMKKFGLLMKSCWDFILFIRNRSNNEVFPYFGVSESSKLQVPKLYIFLLDLIVKIKVVISKLLATNVHHMYVIDDNHIPRSVISFSDVCEALLYDA